MRERPLPLRALHKHRNRHPDTLIDVDHDNFFLIAKKNRDAAAARRYGADLYFDNRLAHVASLGSHVASGYRILQAGQNRVDGSSSPVSKCVAVRFWQLIPACPGSLGV